MGHKIYEASIFFSKVTFVDSSKQRRELMKRDFRNLEYCSHRDTFYWVKKRQKGMT